MEGGGTLRGCLAGQGLDPALPSPAPGSKGPTGQTGPHPATSGGRYQGAGHVILVVLKCR